MSTLKNSIFWIAFYMICVIVLAQFDYNGSPIIDFPKYFYFAAIGVLPVIIFFPSISKVNVLIPMTIWGVIYAAVPQVIDRTVSSDGTFGTVVLEFVVIEIGVWIGYQLANGISHAESVMDALALSAFPNNIHDIELEGERIKIELTRSRRYHRPLSLLVVESWSDDQKITREMLKSVQYDLTNRFVTARIGQIIDDRIRQTDLLLKDSHGRFFVLCPETDINNITLLGERIGKTVKERTNLHVIWGVASFPDEALTFDDLVRTARDRLAQADRAANEQAIVFDSN